MEEALRGFAVQAQLVHDGIRPEYSGNHPGLRRIAPQRRQKAPCGHCRRDPGEILASGKQPHCGAFRERGGRGRDAGPDGFPAVLLLQQQFQIQAPGHQKVHHLPVQRGNRPAGILPPDRPQGAGGQQALHAPCRHRRAGPHGPGATRPARAGSSPARCWS